LKYGTYSEAEKTCDYSGDRHDHVVTMIQARVQYGSAGKECDACYCHCKD